MPGIAYGVAAGVAASTCESASRLAEAGGVDAVALASFIRRTALRRHKAGASASYREIDLRMKGISLADFHSRIGVMG